MNNEGGLSAKAPHGSRRGRPGCRITLDHRPGRPMACWIESALADVNMELEKSFSFTHLIVMITSAQIRAGRGLLKWTQGVLASQAAISAVTLNMIESDQVSPRSKTLDAIRRVLEGEGVRFIGTEADGFGVLLSPRSGPHDD